MKKSNVSALTRLAILTALVFVLQFWGITIKIGPTSFSLVLVPIAIGAMLCGPGAGAFLGFIFGAITLWGGISGGDFFTATLFNAQPFATAVICLGKGILAGFVPGVIYKALKNVNDFAASVVAALSAPIVNTGLFVLGCFFLVSETLNANLANFGVAEGTTLVYFVFIGCAGLNFVAEFLVNTLLSPAIHRIIKAVDKHI